MTTTSNITRRRTTGPGGFTLVEMTVVIVIIAIASAMIVPQLASRMGATKLRHASRQVFVSARYARLFAATRRRGCRLIVDQKRNRFSLVYQVDPQHDPQQYQPLRRDGIKDVQLGPGVRFARVLIDNPSPQPAQHSVIAFDPQGGATAAVIQLTDGRRTWSVLIEPNTGRVELVDYAVGQLPNDRQDLDA